MPACPAESVTIPVIVPVPCCANAPPPPSSSDSSANGSVARRLRYRLDIGPPLGLRKPSIVPCKTSIDHIDDVLRLAHAMSLARITHHDRRHSNVFERDEELLRLGDRNV